MATRYVTLKDSNGDTIYPQSVISQVANGEITTGLIADEAVTDAKVDWDTVNHAMLTYQTTEIPDNSDLNTLPFLKVGTYFVGTNNSASTISNCPASLAFKMEVTAHGGSIGGESTNPWVRRFRILTDINGWQWIQVAYAWGTAGVINYGKWRPIDKNVYGVGSEAQITDGVYMGGRQRITSNVKHILTEVVLDGELADDVTTITFTPSSYNEAFGPNGILFSWNNPTSSQVTFSCNRGGTSTGQRNTIKLDMTIVDSGVTLTNNACCTVKLYGKFTFS